MSDDLVNLLNKVQTKSLNKYFEYLLASCNLMIVENIRSISGEIPEDLPEEVKEKFLLSYINDNFIRLKEGVIHIHFNGGLTRRQKLTYLVTLFSNIFG
jgi:hypothetical protein